MPGIYQPLTVTIGTVVGAFQGTNGYDVITDFGRFRGVFHGMSRGPGGVMESGALMPNVMVWVAFSPGEPICQILGAMLPIWPSDPENDPQQPSVYPQVAGFKFKERAMGRLYDESVYKFFNRPNDSMHDFVNGEWAMTSPHGGGGVGVELFRSWIRGGPYSGLWCWHDTQLTRLAGLDFEFLTLAQSDYDKRLGNAIVKSNSRVFFPDEAIHDKQPRELKIDGAIHGGSHRFLAPAADHGIARPALFHEFLGTDGSYSITSAAGIYLQRFAGISVPEESHAEIPENPALLAEQPLDADTDRTTVLENPRTALTGNVDGITWIQHALDVIHSVTSHKGRGGFDRLAVQWPDKGQPVGVPEDLTHTVYTADMWRRLPQATAFNIEIDAVEKTKKFYVGRSVVALMPDGSVLIEDAFHSQILMSGGSLMLSAPNDIVIAAGRNIVGIAGRDAGLRANRHIDIAANEGRVSVKAEDQLALLGGNNGQGGVLIESKAEIDTSKPGTGKDQAIGGIFLKSKTGLYGEGLRVGLTATNENILLKAENGSTLVKSIDMTMTLESSMLANIDGKGYAFFSEAATMPGSLVVDGQFDANDMFANGGIVANGSIIATGSIGAVGGVSIEPIKGFNVGPFVAAAAAAKAIVTTVLATAKAKLTRLLALRTPINEALAKLLGFSFHTSQQINLDRPKAFELPETRWQTMSRRGGHGASQLWQENPVVSSAGDTRPTSPLPGYEAWTLEGTFRLHNADLYIDLESGAPKPTVVTDASKELTEEGSVPLDGNYSIGTNS